MTRSPRFTAGAAHAPAHKVYGAIIADLHGGDWRTYAAWIQKQPNALKAMKRLHEDRQAAWDILLDIAVSS